MSFRRRLLLVMLAVLVIAQLGTAVATLDTIRRDVLQKGGREIDVALDVTRELLVERGRPAQTDRAPCGPLWQGLSLGGRSRRPS